MVDSIVVHSDGAARGNPGPAAIAYAIYDDKGNVLDEDAKRVGVRTNNEAEYEALIWAIERARAFHPRIARFRCDSELVVRQVLGQYAVREENMKIRLREVLTCARSLRNFEITHVGRDDPKARHVDDLANASLDECAVNG